MDDPIRETVAGHYQTAVALDMVSRRGYAPDEVAGRLLCQLAGGFNCLDEIAPKEQRRLANKTRHAAVALSELIHSLHLAYLDVLVDNKIIEATPDQPLPDADPKDEFQQFLAKGAANIDATIAHLTERHAADGDGQSA
jgi:hypothetical protein